MRYGKGAVALAVMLLGGCASAPLAKVATPQGEAVVLRDGSTELTCVPDIGRVMSFSRKGEANLLWTNPAATNPTVWSNYGGDKTWPWPQDVLWSWPPPTKIDPGPYRETGVPNGFRLEGSADPVTGLAASRETTLAGGIVQNIYSFTRRAESKRGKVTSGVAAWAITQTAGEGTVYVRRNAGAAESAVTRLMGAALTVQPAGPRWVKLDPPTASGKIGLPGSAVAVRRGDRVLLIERVEPIAPTDPWANVTAQIYAYRDGANDDHYTELELIGPTRPLALGESVSLHTEWQILEGAAFDRMLAAP